MKVSVVLPVFNAESTIERAIRSILQQTFADFELIVVDDGSTDNTTRTVQRMTSMDDRLRLFHLSRSGIARALNFGIKMSSGKYIARMDADDFSLSTRLKQQVEYLDTHTDTGLVSSLVRYKGDTVAREGYATYVNWINTIITSGEIQHKRFAESPFSHPSVMFRRHLVHRFGGYQEGKLPEDYELWLRWLHHGVAMAKVNDYLLEWHDYPERLSRNHSHYAYERFFLVKSRYLKLYLKQQFGKLLPPLWVWGAGRVVNNRVRYLKQLGLTIDKFIDVKLRNDKGERFIHYTRLPAPGNLFILCYVSDRRGKADILQYLGQKGYNEGVDFLMMA
ncbi:Glycosyl transferase, group 2 family protein [Fulvivirga imtechensis AK7]|uniref:Glycosyl transferase, group 2 family protein n=1 Tax=Fulvivirga imtechensis AK7 TaxID=1237149 RepID=L8JUR7_9BACT|nr:glycosyltransferase family 2 protein [Fulvivirga imtechensis]ELR71983.1 Glycosyl transferase, group 2 family protein [Fulvivirga imtechensis AK7]